jgi:4-amino-4-deoxy-L-arabinose transferase
VSLTLSLLWKLWSLGHTDLTYWDESFHALVARNLLKHPFEFTLYDQPWLEFPFQDWVSAHVWLHKPPLAMWQIAISYLVLGVDLVALRMPSVVLSTASAFLTYRIGCVLFQSKWVGVVAAALQAFNPFLMGSVLGYYFSDHIDVAVIFWIEVGLYALIRGVQTGRLSAYLLAGAGLGAAFLTKAFPAFIVAGVAVALLACRYVLPRARGWRIAPTHVGAMAGAAFVVVLPWIVYASMTYPEEFLFNAREMLGHLTSDVERWRAPWDRFLFDYLIHQVPWLYTMVIVSLGYLTVRALRGDLGDLLVVLWAWGVLVPFSLAVSKPNSAILIALPALLLGFARVLQLAWSRDEWHALATWTAVATAMIMLPYGQSSVVGREGLPVALRTGFAPYLTANAFVIAQLGVVAVIVAVLAVVRHHVTDPTLRRLRIAQLAVAIVVTSTVAALYGASGRAVVFRPQSAPVLRSLGEEIRAKLPREAALIMDVTRAGSDPHTDGYHLTLMFWSDRSVYRLGSQLAERDLADVIAEIRAAGGVPMLVSDRPGLSPPPSIDGGGDRFRVYPMSTTLAAELRP